MSSYARVLYLAPLLLLQLFKAHMDYVDRTRAPMSADKSSDNNVYATPRRYCKKTKTFHFTKLYWDSIDVM